MKRVGSLQCSQDVATGAYPGPDESNPLSLFLTRLKSLLYYHPICSSKSSLSSNFSN